MATVKAHVSRLMVKLEADNRVQLANRVHDAGLPELPTPRQRSWAVVYSAEGITSAEDIRR